MRLAQNSVHYKIIFLCTVNINICLLSSCVYYRYLPCPPVFPSLKKMLQLMEKMNLLNDFYIFNFFLFKFLHESFETFLSDIIQVKNESFLNVILFTDIFKASLHTSLLCVRFWCDLFQITNILWLNTLCTLCLDFFHTIPQFHYCEFAKRLLQ